MESSVQKINILYCIPSLEVGGAEIFLVRLFIALEKKAQTNLFLLDLERHKRDENLAKALPATVTLIDNPLDNPTALKFIEKAESILRFRKHRLLHLIYGIYLKRLVKKNRISVVHSHLYRSDRVIAAAGLKCKLITTLHGCYNAFGPERMAELTGILEKFKAIIYITERNLSPLRLSAKKESLLAKTIKIYNGINHIPSSDLAEPEIHSALRAVVVSRCIPEKGWDIVIEAVKRINSPDRKIHLTLVGDGPFLPALRSEFLPDDNIVFAGKQMDVFPFIAQANVCCFASTYKNESLPNSILEYMSCGKPIITTDIGETREMVTHEGLVCGFIAPAGKEHNELVDFFEKKIRVYMENVSLLREHGRIARNCIKKFDIQRTADQYLSLYLR